MDHEPLLAKFIGNFLKKYLRVQQSISIIDRVVWSSEHAKNEPAKAIGLHTDIFWNDELVHSAYSELTIKILIK